MTGKGHTYTVIFFPRGWTNNMFSKPNCLLYQVISSFPLKTTLWSLLFSFFRVAHVFSLGKKRHVSCSLQGPGISPFLWKIPREVQDARRRLGHVARHPDDPPAIQEPSIGDAFCELKTKIRM